MRIKTLLAHRYLLVLAIAYTSLIAWLSLARIFIPVDIKVIASDKIGHLLAYFVFTIVWFLFFFYSVKQRKNFLQSLIRASVFGFLFGVLMEMLQALLTSYRSPDWYDVLANSGGIIFAIILLKVLKNKLVSVKGLLT
ncbi:VanZ family protein [Aquimarina sp. SS2-1]|uniref:VanZ family protein n=1 Tax=Aquimarina besae TaxID=3342247 RepID=UPI0036729DE9